MAFTTDKSLLAKVRAGDEISWHEFYRTYRPLVLLCAQNRSLTKDESEELVQQVMREIYQKNILDKYDPDHLPKDVVFKYDPAKGRFRHYLRKIISNQALKIYHRRKPLVALEDIEHTSAMPRIDDWDELWENEWRKHLLYMALEELKKQIQPAHYMAFDLYALQGRSPEETAELLGISLSSVYTIKSRCINAMKEIIEKLKDD